MVLPTEGEAACKRSGGIGPPAVIGHPKWERLVAWAKSIREASRPTRLCQPLDTAVLRDTSKFASLQAEWDELYDSCPSATPFQSWEWLYSWWEAYEEAYDLRLITLRQEGILVGLLPLMVRRWPSLGRLLLIGGDKMTLYSDVMTPYKDILIREGWEEPVAQAGARALKELDGWSVADLQELMPDAAAWGLFRNWDGPKTSVPITDYVLMRAYSSWEELLSSLSRKLRKTARRTLRRMEEDGLRCQPATPEDAGRAARTLVDLHRELWRGRRIAPEHLTPRYEAFMEAAARRMSERGIGRISEFRRDDGEVLVSQFLVFDKDFVGVYVTGASDEASRRYQFETLSNWDALEVARGKSSQYVSFMDGATPDKLRWASEVVSSHRITLGRKRTSSWLPYAAYYILRERCRALRSQTQSYMHSEGAPWWISNATRSYYTLLSYVNSEDTPPWIQSATQRYWELRGKYGYGWLRYEYELIRARQQMKTNTTSKGVTE
jgi:CelD/BcsL family acetyltransferase involved in cellulose biosynthesis